MRAVAVLFLLAGATGYGGVFEFGERPLGTEANRNMAAFLGATASQLGYETESLPFKCPRWEGGTAYLDRGGVRIPLHPGPFTPSFDQLCDAVAVESTQQLKRTRCEGKLVVLRGEIAKEPLLPLDYPFYHSAQHREIYAMLDEREPAAVVAVTGKHPACGLNPFPLFNDANFKIPNAYMDAAALEQLLAAERGKIRVTINSKIFPETGEQWIFRKKATGESKGKLLILAHMDSAYGTPGALDNAAGVAVLVAVMERLKDYAGPYDLEFIPFNGEDSPMVKGEQAYLQEYGREIPRIRLGINIDSVGCTGSKTAVSTYNLDEDQQAWLDGEIAKFPKVGRGPEWVESDHSIFVFRGTPCLALTSSNLRETVTALSHTPQDTVANVDRAVLVETADFVAELVRSLE